LTKEYTKQKGLPIKGKVFKKNGSLNWLKDLGFKISEDLTWEDSYLVEWRNRQNGC